MWNRSNKEDQDLKKAIFITSDHELYGEQMAIVINKWKNTMLNHLTNPSINHKAFIGHCAVCYKYGIPEYITRKAWSFLNNKEKRLANLQAEKYYKLWYTKELNNTLKNGNKDVIKKTFQMKFQFP